MKLETKIINYIKKSKSPQNYLDVSTNTKIDLNTTIKICDSLIKKDVLFVTIK